MGADRTPRVYAEADAVPRSVSVRLWFWRDVWHVDIYDHPRHRPRRFVPRRAIHRWVVSGAQEQADYDLLLMLSDCLHELLAGPRGMPRP